MRKFLLLTLTGAAIALATPQSVLAMPVGAGSGINVAAENVSSTMVVHHRRWHRHHHHRRHWSGRRCW